MNAFDIPKKECYSDLSLSYHVLCLSASDDTRFSLSLLNEYAACV